MKKINILVLLFSATACVYTAPLDPEATEGLNTIAGTIVINGTRQLGPTFVLVYDVHAPPPPEGTGRPVSFASVPQTAFNTTVDGLIAADYAVPNLPDGEYLISALMDVDNDFHPIIANGALAGATCGDWLGAYVSDVLNPQFASVTVQNGQLQDDVTLAVAQEVQLERPAFYLQDDPTVSRSLAGSSPNTQQLFSLRSTAVHSTAGTELTGPFDGSEPCDTAFAVVVYDRDGNGLPDPHPDATLAALGAYDIWPEIYLQYLGEPDGSGGFINDLDPGEAYLGQSLIVPDFLSSGSFPLNTPVLLTSLDVLWIPGAIHVLPNRNDTVVTNPLALPPGAWAVSAISPTGQTWSVPNGLAAFDSTEDTFIPELQATVLLVE